MRVPGPSAAPAYDALISPRLYRDAWSEEQAIAFLRRESGETLDQRCVTALERVLAREHADGLAIAV